MKVIRTIADLEQGMRELIAIEPRFFSVAQQGLPPLRRSRGGFATLVEIIVAQMISLHASQSILLRLRSAFGPFEPAVIAQASIQQLQKIGLSRAKAEAIRTLAQAVTEGRFDFQELRRLDDGAVQARLMALPGVGPWSADIYLLTALGRRDAWPCSDVALQTAAQMLFGLEARPGAKGMEQLAQAWRPWRAVAARLLWAHYRRGKPMA
jgi:DNA-3-methyladenine glycosylase II